MLPLWRPSPFGLRVAGCLVGLLLAQYVWGAGRLMPPAWGQGKLEQLRQDVRPPQPAQDEVSSERPSEQREPAARCHRCRRTACNCNSDRGSVFEPLFAPFGYALFYGVTLPFWGPPVLLHDDYGVTGYFPRFPYEDTVEGFVMRGPEFPVDRYWWYSRVQLEYGSDMNNVSRIGGRVLWETTSRFGIDTEWNYVGEKLPHGRRDQLGIGDFNIVYRFAQSEQVQMRTGLGANWMVDDGRTDLGVNFTYGGDWFPHSPWILSADLDWGRLGKTSLFHGRVSVGVQRRGVELYTGFDYYDIGNTQLKGLIGGLRYWY